MVYILFVSAKFLALLFILFSHFLFVMICIGALCNRRQKEQRSNQRALEMSERQSSYEPPVVQGERVPTPMGRVPPSKLDSPRGAVV